MSHYISLLFSNHRTIRAIFSADIIQKLLLSSGTIVKVTNFEKKVIGNYVYEW